MRAALLLLGRRLYWVFVAGVGILAGAYLFHALAQAFGWGEWAWVGFLVGGVVGVLLVLAILDWALIALSTLVGATVIVQNVPLEAGASGLLFLVLSIVGFLVQVRQKRSRPQAA